MILPFRYSLTKLVKYTYVFFIIVFTVHFLQLAYRYYKVKADFNEVCDTIELQHKQQFEVRARVEPVLCQGEKIKLEPCSYCEEYIDLYLKELRPRGLKVSYASLGDRLFLRYQWKTDVSLIPSRETYYPIKFAKDGLCKKH